MCIRDRDDADLGDDDSNPLADLSPFASGDEGTNVDDDSECCLLYTSDAADERSSVDLGGRRIIQKKKNKHFAACRCTYILETNDICTHIIT